MMMKKIINLLKKQKAKELPIKPELEIITKEMLEVFNEIDTRQKLKIIDDLIRRIEIDLKTYKVCANVLYNVRKVKEKGGAITDEAMLLHYKQEIKDANKFIKKLKEYKKEISIK